jgi:hypothetical protein
MAIAKLNELGLVENGSCQYISEKMDGGLVYNTKINAVIYDDDITTDEVQNRLITGKYAYMLTDVYGCQYLIGIDSAPYPEIVFNNLNDFVGYINGATNGASNGASNGAEFILEQFVHSKVKDMLIATDSWISREKLFETIGLSNQSKNRSRYLDPLIEFEWIDMKYPNSPTHPEQQYQISEKGKKVLSLVN